MPRLTAALGALVLFFSFTPAQAQTACVGGTASGYPCGNIDFYANVPRSAFTPTPPGRNNDIWGWTDPDTGREYALVGLENGTGFVDVTDPAAPVYLGKLPSSDGTSVWRDVKVYADHAFIVADGVSNHGMQVFDLTRLRDVPTPPVTFTADTVWHEFGSAHNIVINEDSGFAYAVGGPAGGGLFFIDISDPLNPSFEGGFPDDGYTHDAQCVTYAGPDTDYTGREICVGAQGTFGSDSHIVVVDVTDKANPVLVSRGFYADATYAHQLWFTEDQRYLLLGDEIDDGASSTTRTMVFDMTDLDSPEFDFFYLGPVETTDHNLYIRGQYAYESNYESGLRILDLSNIADGTITEVGFFDTFPSGNGESYDGQWSNYPFFPSGTIIANDRNNGLFVLRAPFIPTAAEPPAAPVDVPRLSEPVPNPSRDRSTLTFTVPTPTEVVAEVLDLRGRRVALLYDGAASPSAPLALAVDGAALPAGLYLVRVSGPGFSATRRLSIVH